MWGIIWVLINLSLSVFLFVYFPLTMIERLWTKAEFLFSALKRRWWLIVRTLSRGSSVSMAVLSQTRLFRVWNPVSFTSFRKCRRERQELRWVMEKCSKWHKKEQREFCLFIWLSLLTRSSCNSIQDVQAAELNFHSTERSARREGGTNPF